MSQAPHFTATEMPGDITSGLVDGCYIGQIRAEYGSITVVLYATAEAPPAELRGWFQAQALAEGPADAFVFRVAPDEPPTWVMVDPGITRILGVRRAAIAIARAA